MILAGLRVLEDFIKTEVRNMPILDDIMDHKVIGPAIREGMLKEGLSMLRAQIQKRFGTVPVWADEQLGKSSLVEIEALSLRLFDVSSVDELFGR